MTIKINYAEIEEEIGCLEQRKITLENILNVIQYSRNEISDTNSGKSINNLLEKIFDYEENLYKGITGLETILFHLKNYLDEMNDYVQAKNDMHTIIVDAYSVLKNIENIKSDSVQSGCVLDGLLQAAMDALEESPLEVDSNTTEYNSGVYESNKNALCESAYSIEASITVFAENIESIGKEYGKLQLFEECDDEHAEKLFFDFSELITKLNAKNKSVKIVNKAPDKKRANNYSHYEFEKMDEDKNEK